MNCKFIRAVLLLSILLLAGNELKGREVLSIRAKQEIGRLDFEIVNNGKAIFFIGDVDRCGATLQVASESINGGIPVSPKDPNPSWKHLVALVPKNEETSKIIWTYKFSIASKEIPKDKIHKITLGIWIASESDFKKTTIESLQLKKFEVEIAK